MYSEDDGSHSIVNKAYYEMKDKPFNGSLCTYTKELFTNFQAKSDLGLTLVVDNLPPCYSAQSIFHYLSSTLFANSGYIEIRFTQQGHLIRGFLKMPSAQKLNAALRHSDKLRMGDNPLLVYSFYSPPQVFLLTIGSTYYCGIHGLPRSWNSQVVKSFLLTMTPVRTVKKVGEDWEFYTMGLRLLRSCFPTRDDVFPTEKKMKIAWWRLLESEYLMKPKEESEESTETGAEPIGLPESYYYQENGYPPRTLGEYMGRGDSRRMVAEDPYRRADPRYGAGRGEYAEESGERRGMTRNVPMGRREQGKMSMGGMRGQGRGRQVNAYVDEEMGPYANGGMSQRMNERMDQRMDQRMNERMDQRMDQRMSQRMNERMDQRMNRYGNQPMSRYANQPNSQPMNRPTNQFSNQYANNQPVNQFSQYANNQPMNQYSNNQPANNYYYDQQPNANQASNTYQPANAYQANQATNAYQANQATNTYQPLKSSPSGVLLEGFIHGFNQTTVVQLLRSFGAIDDVRFIDPTTSYPLSLALI